MTLLRQSCTEEYRTQSLERALPTQPKKLAAVHSYAKATTFQARQPGFHDSWGY